MRKTDIDYQGRWPFETAADAHTTEAAHAATDVGAEQDPHRAARGIGLAVLVGVCAFSLFAALFVVVIGAQP